jgi:hypothetical protein
MGLFLPQQARRPRPAAYEHGGHSWELLPKEASGKLRTRFGEVRYRQPEGRRVDLPDGPRDLPMARELKLPGGFSLPVVATLARLCSMMAFRASRELFQSLFLWVPSPRAVLRMVDAVGGRAYHFAA